MTAADNPFEAFFDLVPTGAVLYAPALDATGEVVDFTFVRLNPAAQRLLGLPARPAATLRQQYPPSVAAGIFAQCRTAYLTGEASTGDGPYAADGLSTPFRLVAQRSGELLVVNLTSLADLPPPVVAEPRLASQAREQQAHAEVEAQRGELQQLFEQAPVPMALFTGSSYVIELANELMAALWGSTLPQLVGRPVFEALPYVRNQGFEAIFAGVLEGTPYDLHEVPVTIGQAPTSRLGYFNLAYTPQRNAQGNITGIVTSAYEVTEQVRARRQVEQLNRELEARTREAQQAQAAAERGQTQLQALLTQAPVAIALFQGEEVRVASANERMAALWGRTPEQVVGQPLVEAVPELRGQGFDEMIRQVQATRVPYVGTEAPATILQNGKLVDRYYNFSCQPIYGAQGELLGVLNVGAEVTEQVEARRQVEQLNQGLEARVQERTRELAEQRTLLGQILGQVPAFIATLSGPEHRYTFFNEPYQQLAAGRTRLGCTVAEVFPEVVEQGFVSLLDQVYATGKPFIGVDTPAQLYDAQTNQNEQRYVDFIYQPLRDAQQQVQGILAFIVDVTERVLTRRQADTMQTALLRATERRAQERQDVLQVFANAPLAVALLREPDHKLDYWNALFDQLFPGAQRGKAVQQVLPALATPKVIAQLDRLYQNGETYQSQATLLPGATPEAAPRYVVFTYQVYRESERIAGVALFLQDVTELVLGRQQVQHLNEELSTTNQELLHSNTQLTRSNADLDAFVYTASHDLKAPITNIEGLLAALREELALTPQDATGIAHLLKLMDDSIARFQRTINNLTSIVRLQESDSQWQEQTELVRVIDDVRLDLASSLEATQAQVVVEVAGCPTLRLAPKDLRSIIYNLLSNALKYRSPSRPPVVQVQAYCDEQGAELRVQDNGLGLSREQQAKLFQLFRRLHQHVEGSGVGLYSIKKLIENIGGSIRVESEEGVGSTFIVRLPA